MSLFKSILLFSLILLFTSCGSIKKKNISYKSGATNLKGFMAYDKNIKGKRPGVLVVHEWWGHNKYAQKRVKMLAKLGYTALALDMYGDGKVANHPKEAGKFAGMIFKNIKEGRKRFNAALEVLKNHPTVDANNIAAIGYCFGGGVVLEMARQGVDIKGVASFHGSLLTPTKARRNKVKASILVLNGAKDMMTKAVHIKKFKKEMKRARVDYKFVNYPGASHSFTNPRSTEIGKKFNLPLAYNKEADEKSWAEMQAFFHRIFK